MARFEELPFDRRLFRVGHFLTNLVDSLFCFWKRLFDYLRRYRAKNSTMKFAVHTLSAAFMLAATDAWVCGPGGFYNSPYSIVTPEEVMRQKEMIRRKQRQILSKTFNEFKNSVASSTSPRYEITDTEDKFQVALDVPGVLMKDIDITLEDDDANYKGITILSIAGKRMDLDDPSKVVSEFTQRFSVDVKTVDVDKISAKLQNGVLVVAAPKDLQRVEETLRKIPIQEVEDRRAAQSEADGTTTPTAEIKVQDTSNELGTPDDPSSKNNSEENPGEISKD